MKSGNGLNGVNTPCKTYPCAIRKTNTVYISAIKIKKKINMNCIQKSFFFKIVISFKEQNENNPFYKVGKLNLSHGGQKS